MNSARFKLARRACGVLLHPTSLPGPYGSGDLGAAAHRFVDFLAHAGQRWWQMLPVGPIGPGNSPYSSPSAMAGSPLLIDLDGLVRDGLLQESDIIPIRGFRGQRVHYRAVMRFRSACLRRAYANFQSRGAQWREPLECFTTEERDWLDEHALYSALKRAHGGVSWVRWPRDLRCREGSALRQVRRELCDEIEYEQFVQFMFARQWSALAHYAEQHGIGLIGDLPMYVVHDSVDVWAHQELFRLDADGAAEVVSGVPPDYFSETGQLWGHPLFRWEQHEATGWTWWLARFRLMFSRFHATRIDHFLGLNRCWAIPGGAPTATEGTWETTPGDALLATVRDALGSVQIIAEDLGQLVPEAAALRDRFEFPGMRVLQFAFGDDRDAEYHRPDTYPANCVVYPGTHDNQTVVGWFREVRTAYTDRPSTDGLTEQERALRYLGTDGSEIHWDFIRAAYASPANLAIIPVQDVLGLDDKARMNTPATTRGNWSWRMPEGSLTPELAQRLRKLVEAYERFEASPASGRR